MLGVFLFVRMETIYSTNELVCCNFQKNVNREFLYQILSSQRFENSMIACGQGAAQMNIGKGDVESYVLPYSSMVITFFGSQKYYTHTMSASLMSYED